MDENGQLQLNKDSLIEVARVRMMDLGVKQATTIIDEMQKALDEDKIERAKELTSVTYGLTEATWDLVDAQRASVMEKMADKGMTADEITSFYNQIEAVKQITNNTIDNMFNAISSSGSNAADEVEDAFQKAMEYWENRIGANQALFNQIQNDIDLLEKKGKIAGESYYQAQMNVENEHLEHLKAQREEAMKYLDQFGPGTEEWFRKKPAYLETYKRIPLNCWDLLIALYTTTQG